jgi:hypothetical protein
MTILGCGGFAAAFAAVDNENNYRCGLATFEAQGSLGNSSSRGAAP